MSLPFENDRLLNRAASARFAPVTPKLLIEPEEFSAEERGQLLAAAHQAIASALQQRTPALTAPSPHLAEPRGVFTTLYCLGELRGCVGYVFPRLPLFNAVAETARAAAFDDLRFPPLTPAELPEIAISISVLSALRPIRPVEIEIGRHGLLIKYGSSRGLLLPQVPVEHHWDVTEFLEQTCRKASLPADAWRQGASIEAFTAESFSDAKPA
jgi:AmmeMemoRadiSam system protein A